MWASFLNRTHVFLRFPQIDLAFSIGRMIPPDINQRKGVAVAQEVNPS